MAKSKVCPECGSMSCARIIYGLPLPTKKLRDQLRCDRFILGGPVEEDYSPQWKCHDCGAEIYGRRIARPLHAGETRRKRMERNAQRDLGHSPFGGETKKSGNSRHRILNRLVGVKGSRVSHF